MRKRLLVLIFFCLSLTIVPIIFIKNHFSKKNKLNYKTIVKKQNIYIKPDGTLYFKKSGLDDKNVYKSFTITDKSKFVLICSPYKQIKNIFKDYKFSCVNSCDKCNLIYDYFYYNKLNNTILGLNRYQKICRIPKTIYLTSKYNFLKELKKASKLYPGEYDFFIESYILPKDKEIFKNRINTSKFWVKKPYNLSRGRGIKIINKVTNFDEKVIVQKYIKPHLLFGKKYDIRIILLITSYDPLVVYLYTDGFLRFATHPYSEKEDFYIEDKFMHLTNNSVNKDSIFYKKNDDPNKLTQSLASLKSFKKYCKENNIDFNSIINKVKDNIIKCILIRYDRSVKELKEYKIKSSKNLFELIGVDIILDDKLEPHILEFNANPSLEWNCKCGDIITNNMLIDTFNLLGIKQYDRNEKENDKAMSINEMLNENIEELKRDRGEYELIFPLKENIEKYKKFIKKDTILNKLLWKYIKENN